MNSRIYVYQSIARAAKDHGTTKMFGLMGDANLFMVDSFVRECGGSFIPAAHEGSTILMATAVRNAGGSTPKLITQKSVGRCSRRPTPPFSRLESSRND